MSVEALYTLASAGVANVERPLLAKRATSDIHLRHTADGGEIDFLAGEAVMSDGLETFCYLSLFGGNELDSGLPSDVRLQWWGNLSEVDPARTYRSETQHLLRGLPAIPRNLTRVEDAAKNDLAALLDLKLATSVSASASIPALHRIALAITVEVAPGEHYRFTFSQSWGART
jgi:phage gp46-like protein